ncbi:Restriction endonuclease [Burkholderia sp. WP9]|uniref:nSTAND3 domain-containing NTPase n=1 Tax=Burkholderia sp. WP9 TaxID=1500263 RepID=UPI000897B8BF|nr:restriction endonuclease [Burkholderia sp. WP9]SEB61482.1 Restriction endonuclease [Burkholderia sp. WP9]
MSYDFTTLSPGDFESLVADLLSRSWGRRLESFKAGKDGGIDLRLSRAAADEGDTVVQCKRYAPHKLPELLRSLKLELPKLAKLRPHRYVLATSVGLTPLNKDVLIELLRPWCQSPGDIFGPDELNGLLREHPEVLKAHFKLWISSTEVLESVLHARIFAFTDATVDATRRQLSKLVVHNGLTRALDLLHQHHHAVIAGNPGIGKTTLARMLMCHYMGNGFEPVMISGNIEDAWTLVHQARDERRKLFIVYDDFLGLDAFDSRRFEKNEDASLMTLLDKVRASSNLRFVLTTREYILEDAKRVHGAFDMRASELVKCTISLADYTETHRARMLFNHLYFSDLPDERLQKFVQTGVYRDIVKHKHFNPRVVEAISSYANSRSMNDDEYVTYVAAEFKNPAKLWSVPFHRHISGIAKHLLACLWSFGGHTEISFLRKCVSLLNPGISPEALAVQFNDAIKQVDGNFIQTGRFAGGNWSARDFHIAQFQNPSVAEFVRQLVSDEPTWLSIILPAVICIDQVNTLFDAGKSRNDLGATFWLKLRQQLRLVEDKAHRRFLSYRYSSHNMLRTVWMVEPTRLSAITLRHLQIDSKAKLPDAHTQALEKQLLTVEAWKGIFQDTLHDVIGAMDAARIQRWIESESGWSSWHVRESNRCYRLALLGIFDDPQLGTLQMSVLESLTRGCISDNLPFGDEERHAVADAARASVAMSLGEEEDPDELRYCVKELKKVEAGLEIDMSMEIAQLERRADDLESQDDEEVEEDSDAEQLRYGAKTDYDEDVEDFDLLFSELLNR